MEVSEKKLKTMNEGFEKMKKEYAKVKQVDTEAKKLQSKIDGLEAGLDDHRQLQEENSKIMEALVGQLKESSDKISVLEKVKANREETADLTLKISAITKDF